MHKLNIGVNLFRKSLYHNRKIQADVVLYQHNSLEQINGLFKNAKTYAGQELEVVTKPESSGLDIEVVRFYHEESTIHSNKYSSTYWGQPKD